MRSSVWIGAVLAVAWIGPAAAQSKIDIFACEPEWAALAKELAGDAAVITTAETGTENPRDVKVTDDLISAIKKAKLVICSGAGLEGTWLPELLKKTPNPSVQPGNSGNLMAADYVIPLDVSGELSEDEDDTGTDINSPDQANPDADAGVGGDPHVHLNPHNIMLVAEELQQRLTQIDPDNRSAYDKLYNAFFSRWQDAMDRWEQDAATLFGTPVATEDDSFAYLIDWLGLVKVAGIEAQPGVAPSKTRIDSLIAALKKRPVRAILATPFNSDPAAKTISAATGAPVLVLPYTVGGDKESPDLFGMFDQTLKLLEKTLSS
jgi:zinc/manganese transport system substrate-binding protein